MTCKECNGTKVYDTGMFTREPCRACSPVYETKQVHPRVNSMAIGLAGQMSMRGLAGYERPCGLTACWRALLSIPGVFRVRVKDDRQTSLRLEIDGGDTKAVAECLRAHLPSGVVTAGNSFWTFDDGMVVRWDRPVFPPPKTTDDELKALIARAAQFGGLQDLLRERKLDGQVVVTH
jgi:hypothetical protein